MTIALAIATVAILTAVTIAAVGCYRSNLAKFNEILEKQENGTITNPLPVERLRNNCFSSFIFSKVFGLHVAVGRWFGNCFSPAIVLEWYGVKERNSSHSPKDEARMAKLKERSTAMYERIMKSHAEELAKPETFSYPAWAKLTIRAKRAETVIYWRGWFRFDLNSEHLAKRFGTHVDTDFGGYEEYKGIFGTHVRM